MVSLITIIGLWTVTVAALWFGLPMLFRRLSEWQLSRLCAAHRAIVLTYDDGPGTVLSPRLVQLLGHHGARATFFLIGARAETHPDIVQALREADQEIGSHTQAHLNAWKTSPLAPVRDIRAGCQTLARLGAATALFRPPFGKATLGTLLFGWRKGLTSAYWTVDSRDSWANPRPVEEVLTLVERRGGGVVLMHDCDAPPRSLRSGSHPDHVLRLTEALISLAAEKRFTLLPLGALLAASRTKA